MLWNSSRFKLSDQVGIFDDISIAAAEAPGGFVGLPESRIENIHLNNVHVRKSGSGWQCQDVDTKSSGATDVTPPLTCL